MAISEGGFSMPPRQNGDAVGINRSVLISSNADEAREYARRQREPAFRASRRRRRAYLETLSAVSSPFPPSPRRSSVRRAHSSAASEYEIRTTEGIDVTATRVLAGSAAGFRGTERCARRGSCWGND